MQDKRCYCDCHSYPGTYPTNESRPCWSCGHVHSQGEMVGGYRDGWKLKKLGNGPEGDTE